MNNKQGERTKEKLLEAGLKLWPNVTNRAVAKKTGMTHPVVAYHFKDGIANAVAAYAVAIGNSKVIAHLVATNHKAIRKMSREDKIKHLNSIF